MTANIELDEGTSGKVAETEEVTTNVHRQVVKVGGVGACALKKSRTKTQAMALSGTPNTDATITTELQSWARYVNVYCAEDFVVAMGESTSSTVGVRLAAGSWVFPVVYTGTAADDKIHAQSSTASATVYVTEMAD